MQENYEVLWDKAIEIELENPTKAIRYYEKTLKENKHPFVYCNIAILYSKLEEYEKSGLWYEKVEEDLLNLEDKYSGIPYANYAWYLNNIKKDYNKALIFSEISIKIEPKNYIYIENHIRILLNLKKIEEATPYLGKARLNIPDWDSVQDLLEKYDKQINKYWKEYWEVTDKDKLVTDSLKSYQLDNETLTNYLFGKSRTIPDIEFENWNNLYMSLLNLNIEIIDPIFIKLFKILIKKEEYEKLINNLLFVIEKTKSGYSIVFTILQNLGINKTNAIELMLKYINDDNEYELEIMIKNLKQNYKSSLKKFYNTFKDNNTKAKIIRLMIKIDYKFYKKDIISYLITNLNSSVFSKLIQVIPDKEEQTNLLVQKHETWLKELKVDDKLISIIKNYLLDLNTSLPDDFHEKYVSINENRFKNYWTIFARRFIFKQDKDWDNKIFKLSMIFSPYNTIKANIGFDNDYFSIIEILNNLNIRREFYVKYLIKEFLLNRKEELLGNFIKNNFKTVTKELKNFQVKEIASILPIVQKNSREESFELLMEYADSSSKTIRNNVEILLCEYKDRYKDLLSLLNSKKMNTRILALNIIKTIDKKNAKKIFSIHKETEKSKTVLEYIEKTLK